MSTFKIVIAADASYTTYIDATTEDEARSKAMEEFEEKTTFNEVFIYDWKIHTTEEVS